MELQMIDRILGELKRLASAPGYIPTQGDLSTAHTMVLEEYYKALMRTRVGKPIPSFHHIREHIDPSGAAIGLLAKVARRGIYARSKA
jgi:hypothetical protein